MGSASERRSPDGKGSIVQVWQVADALLIRESFPVTAPGNKKILQTWNGP
jgi:hypothetical protein